MRSAGIIAVAIALTAGFTRPSAAQSTVTSADVQRLQDNVYEASRDLAQLAGEQGWLWWRMWLPYQRELPHLHNGANVALALAQSLQIV